MMAVRLLWLVPATEVGLMLYLIWTRTPDVPMVDEWFLVETVRRWREGTLDLAHLLSFHNEHRIFIPRVISLAVIQATDWHRQIWMTVNVIIAIATFGFFLQAFRRSLRDTLLTSAVAVALAIVFFAPSQKYNYLMPFQTAFFSTIFGVALTHWATATGRPIALPFTGALIATLSTVGGLMVWPAYAVTIWQRSKPAFAAWCATGAISMALYFTPKPVTNAVHIFDPIRNVLFSLAFIGAPLGFPDPIIAMVFGAAGLAALAIYTAAVARHGDNEASMLPWLCLAAFVLLNAGITSYGRLMAGYGLAMSPYRQAFSLLFWMALIVIAAIALARHAMRRMLIALPLAIFTAAFVRSAYVAYTTWDVDNQVRQQNCIVEWEACPPEVRYIFTYRSPPYPEFLREQRLSIFRH